MIKCVLIVSSLLKQKHPMKKIILIGIIITVLGSTLNQARLGIDDQRMLKFLGYYENYERIRFN